MSAQQPFSDELMMKINAQAQREGVPVMDVVRDAVVRYLEPARPPVVSLAGAAEVFLGAIDQGQAALIRDICRDTGHQPADYLLSYIYLAHERGETAALVGEHVMLRHEDDRQRPVLEHGYVPCDYCRTPFLPTRRGQRFCPEPADPALESCGRKASLEALHAHRGRRGPRDNRYAPAQQNVEVYRRAAQQAQELGVPTLDEP